MGDATAPATSPSRRLVGLGTLGAVVSALTGCGIRLEDDAPRVPLVPTREPIAAEPALLRLLAAVRAASLAPVDPKARLSPMLGPLHASQADVLRDALRRRGVPESALPSPSPTPSASPPTPTTATAGVTSPPGGSPTPAPAASPTAAASTLVDVEGSLVTAADGCSEAEAELRPPVLALLAQVHAAVELTRGRPADPPSPAPTWSAPEALVPLVTATRRAVYELEVAAARQSGAAQRVAKDGLARLDALTAELVEVLGDAAPPPELGHPLPRPVRTPADATALATAAMATLLGAWGSQLAGLTATDPDAAFASVPRWLGMVAAEAHRRGTPLAPFPGLG